MKGPRGGTAAAAGLVSCHVCQRVWPKTPAPKGHQAHCPTCGAPLHSRRPDSLACTWALVLAAAVFYVPANVFPVMTVLISGRGEPDTIMSGIVALAESGSLVIAIVIFFASVTVPMAKLLGLSYLMLSVQYRWLWRPKSRTKMFRVIEVIGRWSMIDMFMVSIVVALVKLGNLATIEPGLGATCFAAVVVITIFAAQGFDPRLIWDSLEKDNDRTTRLAEAT